MVEKVHGFWSHLPSTFLTSRRWHYDPSVSPVLLERVLPWTLVQPPIRASLPSPGSQICMMRIPHSPYPGLAPFLRNDFVGAGLKSERSITGGTFLIDYTGSESTQPIEGPFVLEVIAGKLWIDGACNGNESKLINHSCDPNCIVHIEPTTRRAMIFARRIVAPKEELTLSYNGELLFRAAVRFASSNK